jgi:hypothetical protein
MMRASLRVSVALAVLLWSPLDSGAELLIRWDYEQIPPRDSLGIARVVIPASKTNAIKNAAAEGYEIYLEVDASALAALPPGHERVVGTVIVGDTATHAKSIERWRATFKGKLLVVDPGAKWPHIRTNWVTKNKDVLQVTGRSAQPWIENNAALIRIGAGTRKAAPLLTYAWKPITLADKDEGPQLENYLVAIAESGSFGGSLLLPLHERFQHGLVLGQPRARADWEQIRRYVEFYSWSLPDRYRAIANIGVVTTEPLRSFEVLNLLARHNLPFAVIPPARLAAATADSSSAFDLLIVFGTPAPSEIDTLTGFARTGGTVLVMESKGPFPWQTAAAARTPARVTYAVGKGRVIERTSAVTDPDAFAMDVRQILGRERRVIDIWNGITVLSAPFQEPTGSSLLLTALNYAHQPLPVQFRVRGTFSMVQYESPEEPVRLLSHQHRDGYTEFLLPALRIGGRVFLSR